MLIPCTQEALLVRVDATLQAERAVGKELLATQRAQIEGRVITVRQVSRVAAHAMGWGSAKKHFLVSWVGRMR